MTSPVVTGPFALGEALAERDQAALLRRRTPVDVASWRADPVGGRDYLNLSANDYLGLADHPAIKAAFKEGIDRYGAGAGASPLVTGYSRAHQQLEEALADWLGVEAVLLFNCGFSANQAVLKALLGKEHSALAGQTQPRLPAGDGQPAALQDEALWPQRHGRAHTSA